jgi:hypothetical protein
MYGNFTTGKGLPVLVLMFSGLLETGCVTLSIGDMENALPQGKGVIRGGIGLDLPLSDAEDTIATRKKLLIADKSPRFSGKLSVRYGLTENTDVGITAWYATSPGYGLGGSLKRSFSLSPSMSAAVFGSVHHFFTDNEVPYWEYARSTYNRTFTGITIGGVGSILISRKDVLSNDAFSAGAKLSVNYATIKRETVYYIDPSFGGDPPPPEFVTTHETFYVASPFVGLSIGSLQHTTLSIEAQLPVVAYDDFKLTGRLYGQFSLGMLFRLFGSPEE